jgi:hypothetical protein
MSNCGQCGGGGAGGICTCFTGNSATATARGNGSISHPFNFVPNHIPNPRPCGHITRSLTVQTLTANIENLVIFDTDQHPFNGGMTLLGELTFPSSRLTAPVSGKYLVGGFVVLSNPGAGNISNLSIGKNGTTTDFEVRKSSQDPGGGTRIMMDVMSLISLSAFDYLELYVFTTLALDITISNTDFGATFNCPASLWAQWVGF